MLRICSDVNDLEKNDKNDKNKKPLHCVTSKEPEYKTSDYLVCVCVIPLLVYGLYNSL